MYQIQKLWTCCSLPETFSTRSVNNNQDLRETYLNMVGEIGPQYNSAIE